MSLGWEEYEEERDYLWNLQTPEFVTFFEAQTWRVAVDLGHIKHVLYLLNLFMLFNQNLVR